MESIGDTFFDLTCQISQNNATKLPHWQESIWSKLRNDFRICYSTYITVQMCSFFYKWPSAECYAHLDVGNTQGGGCSQMPWRDWLEQVLLRELERAWTATPLLAGSDPAGEGWHHGWKSVSLIWVMLTRSLAWPLSHHILLLSSSISLPTALHHFCKVSSVPGA